MVGEINGVLFRASRAGLLRMPLLPVGSLAADASVDLDDCASMISYVENLIKDERVREALSVSSTSMHSVLDDLATGSSVKPKALRKMVVSATRYALRATNRSTPFGLLAGVAAVSYGDRSHVRLGERHHKVVRPDVSWLREEVTRWERQTEILLKLRVVSNDLAFRRGQRLVIERSDETSVRFTNAVEIALGHARQPVPASDVVAAVRRDFPDVPPAAVSGLVVDLVEQGFLLTELMPSLTDTDPLGHVVRTLDSGGAADAVAELTALAAMIERYQRQPIGCGLADWTAVTTAMRRRHSQDHVAAVDLAMDADVRLPETVLHEVERAVSVLHRLAPAATTLPHIAEYHRTFLERYGQDQAIPLLDVLDPHAGLGLPAGYGTSRDDQRDDTTPSDEDRRREAWLWRLMSTAIGSRAPEVRLDDDIVDAFAAGRDLDMPAPGEVCVHLTAASQQALDDGDFTAVLSPATASPYPGSLAGRFAYLHEDLDLVGDLAREAARLLASEDAVPLSVDFRPDRGRIDNVARAPGFWPEHLAVGTFGASAAATRRATDLAVAADLNRLYFVDAATGQEVVPQFPYMANAKITPAPIRFMIEVARARVPRWLTWSWGVLNLAPYLPRIRYERTVLSPARWHLADRGLTDRTVPDADWDSRLTDWRHEWAVPDRVMVGTRDRRVTLDLSSTLHRMLLRRELHGGGDVVVTETPADAGQGYGWLRDSSGDRYASELVVSLFPRQTEPIQPAARRFVNRPHPQHHREWLQGKLFTSIRHQDDILTDHLPRLLDELSGLVDRWFFVRYTSPEPHLRLRFHTRTELVHGHLTPALFDWADDLIGERLAKQLVIDRYEPEVARYGGQDAITAAERMFHQDSVAVVDQLRSRATASLQHDKTLLTAINCIDIVQHVFPDSWTDWFLRGQRSEEHHAYFRRRRVEAIDLQDQLSTADPARTARAAALQDYPEARRDSILLSILHMHHNRLVGPDRLSEARSYAVARGLAHVTDGRRRHLT